MGGPYQLSYMDDRLIGKPQVDEASRNMASGADSASLGLLNPWVTG